MSITLNLRYQQKDRYGSEIFIVSKKYPEEAEPFNKLQLIEHKLKEMNLGTFLPIYSNQDIGFCTIRFKFYKGIKLEERSMYTVKFDIKQNEKNDNSYINCFISNIKMHTKALQLDHGTTLNFEI